MIVSTTPFNIPILGEDTGCSPWMCDREGLVVGGAIDSSVKIIAEQASVIDGRQWSPQRADLDLFESLGRDDIDLLSFEDIPAPDWVSNAIGTLKALSAFDGEYLTPNDLLVRTSGALRASPFSAHGGFGVARFYRDGQISVDRIDPGNLASNLALFFVEASSGEVSTPPEKIAEWYALAKMAEDGLRCINAADWERLGQLVDRSWRISVSLGAHVTEKLSKTYAAARVCGAWGGKYFGDKHRYLLTVVHPEKRASVVSKMESEGLRHVPFQFTPVGSVAASV